MRDNSYTVVKRWMVTELGLSGNELIVFAVLYGYTVNGRGYYSGLSELELWTGASKRGIMYIIDRLVDKGLVERFTECGRTTTTYRTLVDSANIALDSAEIAPDGADFALGGANISPQGAKIAPNNIDNINNINNIIVQSAHADVDDSVKKPTPKMLTDEFVDVWKLYPRKEGKVNALKAYIKARQEGVSKDTIVAGVNAYVAHIRKEHIEPSYIKMGSTWFHQRCWEDSYGVTQSPQTAPTEQDEAIRRLVYARQQARKAAQDEAAE